MVVGRRPQVELPVILVLESSQPLGCGHKMGESRGDGVQTGPLGWLCGVGATVCAPPDLWVKLRWEVRTGAH